jgi:hypothetical protein
LEVAQLEERNRDGSPLLGGERIRDRQVVKDVSSLLSEACGVLNLTKQVEFVAGKAVEPSQEGAAYRIVCVATDVKLKHLGRKLISPQ